VGENNIYLALDRCGIARRRELGLLVAVFLRHQPTQEKLQQPPVIPPHLAALPAREKDRLHPPGYSSPDCLAFETVRGSRL
jgi:hypothetical protein